MNKDFLEILKVVLSGSAANPQVPGDWVAERSWRITNEIYKLIEKEKENHERS